MTDKLPPPLLALFAPRPPLRFLAPTDSAPEHRRTAAISGLSQYLDLLNTPVDDGYIRTETGSEEVARRREERKQEHDERIRDGLKEWDPKSDPLVKGDPFQTLFVGRLSYDVNEQDLDNEFSRFGQIDRIRIVRDKKTGKPRGYGFVVFARERDMRAAYKSLNGARIKNRAVVVDVERGRTVKSWRPRWLGGGSGGRGYTKAALLRPSRLQERPSAPGGGGGGRYRDGGGSGGGGFRDRDWDHRGGSRYDRDRRDNRDRDGRYDRRDDSRYDRRDDRRDDRDRWSKRPRYN
ncbi:hypothetical protein V1514DRAFT_332507 [Lipomyces japonicus]|uniref:uncharacterized protein n=1 Tax=Lipomyces japonicus TaxID=56871 RepID=UPI0034CE338F